MNSKIQLRKIVIATIIVILLLLAFTVVLSLLWPSFWNPSLGSTFINIASSLIGVFAGVLLAIFIVERYLENQRREAQRKEQLRRDIYMSYISGWLHGSLSVYTEGLTHLSYFLLYGREKWFALVGDSKEKVRHETIYDFLLWLTNVYMAKKGMTKKELAKFKKGFDEALRPLVTMDKTDLRFLIGYVEMCANCIRDNLFLFQPFMEENFELARKLLSFVRFLESLTHRNSYFTGKILEDISLSSFDLDARGQSMIKDLGQKAVEITEMIFSYRVEGKKTALY